MRGQNAEKLFVGERLLRRLDYLKINIKKFETTSAYARNLGRA